jgi:hypothetical protein
MVATVSSEEIALEPKLSVYMSSVPQLPSVEKPVGRAVFHPDLVGHCARRSRQLHGHGLVTTTYILRLVNLALVERAIRA